MLNIYTVFAKTVINNQTKFYSVCPLLACITRSNLHLKLSTVLRTGCGKSPWTKIKSEFSRFLNGYS